MDTFSLCQVALEESMEVKESLLRSYDPRTAATFPSTPELYRKIRLSLSIFHGVINERVHFKQVRHPLWLTLP